jgi:glycosyltransferase involved in cell wall biosynthesis
MERFTSWALQKFFYCTPVPVRHFVRDLMPEDWVFRIRRNVGWRSWEKIVDSSSKAKEIESKLWGGFSEQAKSDLIELREDSQRGISERARAAWALARWFWVARDHESVLENLQFFRSSLPERYWYQSFRLLEIDCLMALGEVALARHYSQAALQKKPHSPHYRLALANTYATTSEHEDLKADDAERLRLINTVLEEVKVSPIVKAAVDKPLALDNLCGSDQPYDDSPMPDATVSIIMPVFKAEDTLPIALDSLLAQTWKQLQIIVVDDCSPDNTFEVAKRYSEKDARVIAVRQPFNQGAYAARNFGLHHATGELVTTHDADDWSHPQKIEIQARDMLATPGRKANLTHWVRALPELYFKGTSRPSERLVQMNHSSLMMWRELLLKLGGWDRVRITGDTELIWRLEHHPEGDKPKQLLEDIPLSFALEDVSSLTRNSRTHVRTMFYGVRREYRESIAHWHEHTQNHSLPLSSPEDSQESPPERPFPAPGFIHAQRTSWTLDRLMLMDFNAPGPALQHAIELLDTWEAAGFSVGIFQWRYYPLDVREPLNADIRDRALAGKLRIITPGESVSSKVTMLASPPLAHYAIDLPPQIDTPRIQVVTSEKYCCLQSETPEGWDSECVKNQLEKLFEVPTALSEDFLH